MHDFCFSPIYAGFLVFGGFLAYFLTGSTVSLGEQHVNASGGLPWANDAQTTSPGRRRPRGPPAPHLHTRAVASLVAAALSGACTYFSMQTWLNNKKKNVPSILVSLGALRRRTLSPRRSPHALAWMTAAARYTTSSAAAEPARRQLLPPLRQLSGHLGGNSTPPAAAHRLAAFA